MMEMIVGDNQKSPSFSDDRNKETSLWAGLKNVRHLGALRTTEARDRSRKVVDDDEHVGNVDGYVAVD